MRAVLRDELAFVAGAGPIIYNNDEGSPPDPLDVLEGYWGGVVEVGADPWFSEPGFHGVYSPAQAQQCANTIMAWAGLGALAVGTNYAAALMGFLAGGVFAIKYSQACNP